MIIGYPWCALWILYLNNVKIYQSHLEAVSQFLDKTKNGKYTGIKHRSIFISLLAIITK